MCSCFRNESGALSSELITEAVAARTKRGHLPPGERDVKPSADWKDRQAMGGLYGRGRKRGFSWS